MSRTPRSKIPAAADSILSCCNVRTIDYYESVVAKLGDSVDLQNALRLFMVPGMTHCGTREGTSTFDRLATLEEWVEQKKTPD